MDQHNNSIGRTIGQISDDPTEIAERTARAIKEQRAITSPQYKNPFEGTTTPIPTPKPAPPIMGTESADILGGSDGDDALGTSTGGLFFSIGDFFSDVGSGISDFFGGILGSIAGDAGQTPGIIATPIKRTGGTPPFINYNKTSTLSLDRLLNRIVEQAAGSLVDKIVGRNPNIFEASAGRVLVQNAERFGNAISQGRINSMEEAFTNVFRGKPGEIGIAADIGNQVIGGLLQAGVGELFGGSKTSTRSYESARSLQADRAFRLSRGQQAAEALAMLQKGKRNL